MHIYLQLGFTVQIPSCIKSVHHQCQLLQCSPQPVPGKQQHVYNPRFPTTSNVKHFNLSIKNIWCEGSCIKNKTNSNCIIFFHSKKCHEDRRISHQMICGEVAFSLTQLGLNSSSPLKNFFPRQKLSLLKSGIIEYP